MSKLMKIPEVAKRLQLSNNRVYAMAQQGEIPAFKLGGQWRVREEALDAWIAKQASEAERGLDFSEGM
jgi:excisionase family DNA binding protein